MSTRWTIAHAMTERPPPLHPLAGANLRTFWTKVAGNESFDARSRLPRLLAAAVVPLRFPFYHFEEIHWGDAIRAQQVERGPIFIVGHWRSGTTHLHNIMSRDPQFGWVTFVQTVLPWEIMIEEKLPIARMLIECVLPKDRGYDNVALSVHTPQEEEWALANMNALSLFNCYYFPRSYDYHFRRGVLLENITSAERGAFADAYVRLVKALHLCYGGKQLLFKNPSATARMTLLKRLFPGARFVHIVRNPYAVFASSLARLPRLMSAFSWQRFDDLDFEETTFLCYEALMKRFLEDRDRIDPADIVETSYERLIEDPMREIDRIYSALDLPREEATFEKIGAYLATISGYEKNVHRMTRSQIDHIEKHWGFAFDAWPYERPDIEIVG